MKTKTSLLFLLSLALFSVFPAIEEIFSSETQDLAMTEAYYYKIGAPWKDTDACVGDKVEINYTIKNVGATILKGPFSVIIYLNDEFIGGENIDSDFTLSSNQTFSDRIVNDFTFKQSGRNIIKVEAVFSADNPIPELHQENNLSIISLDVADATEIADLEVKNLQYCGVNDPPYVGDAMGYEISLTNNGNIAINQEITVQLTSDGKNINTTSRKVYIGSGSNSTFRHTVSGTRFTDVGQNNFSVSVDPFNWIEETNENNNSANASVNVLSADLKPDPDPEPAEKTIDLEIRDLQYYGESRSPRVGDTIGCKFDIFNIGNYSINQTVGIGFKYGDKIIDAKMFPNIYITPGYNMSMEHIIEGEYLSKTGENNITVTVDLYDDVVESNENNNSMSHNFNVLSRDGSELPDLQISNLQYYGDSDLPSCGGAMNYKFDVLNSGMFAINQKVLFTFFIKNDLVHSEIKDINLASGEYETFKVATTGKNFTHAGDVKFFVKVDPDNEIREENENNNAQVSVLKFPNRPNDEDPLDLIIGNVYFYDKWGSYDDIAEICVQNTGNSNYTFNTETELTDWLERNHYFAAKVKYLFIDDHKMPLVITPGFSRFSVALDKNSIPSIYNNVSDGALVKLPNDSKIYLIEGNKRSWIRTAEEFRKRGYQWEDIKNVSAEIMNKYAESVYSSAKLLRASGNNRVYRIIDGKRLWVPTASAFNDQGLKWDDVQSAGETDVDKYPKIKLIKGEGDDRVFYVTNLGMKKHIINAEVFNSYDNNKDLEVVKVSSAVVNSFHTANLFRDENGNKIYKIEGNTKKWIKTAEAFRKNNLDWNKVISVNNVELNAYGDGGVIE